MLLSASAPSPGESTAIMHVGIDFTSAARQRAGIGRYARELIRALACVSESNEYRLFVPRDARRDLLQFDWPSCFTLVRAPLTERLLAAFWHRARVPLPVEAFMGPVDVFYSPDFLLPPTRAGRTLVTIHDLSYVRVPECFPGVLRNYLNHAVPRAVHRADLVLADASSTQRDLVEVYGVPPDKVRVLYSGVDARFRHPIAASERERVRGRFKLPKHYILSVGTIQPRKNYRRLVEAFAAVLSKLDARLPDVRLVIAGGRGWMDDEVYRTVDRVGIGSRVQFLGFVPEEDLPALYGAAALFAFPSLYEGFGLPVAEAMACGVPVVCSNTSSLPEVAGDAALYFDPCDVGAMAGALERGLGDESLRADLRERALERVQRFSWERAAHELCGYLSR